jgi:hypothetical protein
VAIVHRTSATAAGLAALALWVPAVAPAGGDPPRPDDVAAIDVYRESVPTASGPRIAGQPSQTAVALLPAAAAAAREHGEEGTTLARVATSPAYGAPTRALPAPLREAEEPTALDSAVTATAGTGSQRLVALMLVLLVTTAGLAMLAGLRVRRERRVDHAVPGE